jgi:uncharacterized membrane protein YqjE
VGSQDDVRRAGTLTLVGQLINNLSRLLDREVELARVEALETVKQTVRSAAVLVIGAALGLLSLIALLVAGILALALVMPGWLAGLIVFAALGILAALLLWIGKRQFQSLTQQPLARTRETLKEDVAWAKHHLRSSET